MLLQEKEMFLSICAAETSMKEMFRDHLLYTKL